MKYKKAPRVTQCVSNGATLGAWNVWRSERVTRESILRELNEIWVKGSSRMGYRERRMHLRRSNGIPKSILIPPLFYTWISFTRFVSCSFSFFSIVADVFWSYSTFRFLWFLLQFLICSGGGTISKKDFLISCVSDINEKRVWKNTNFYFFQVLFSRKSIINSCTRVKDCRFSKWNR